MSKLKWNSVVASRKLKLNWYYIRFLVKIKLRFQIMTSTSRLGIELGQLQKLDWARKERIKMRSKIQNTSKVHIFWEGHKILRNLHLTFVLCKGQAKSNFSIRGFLQKTNKWLQFYYYEACFRSFFEGNWRRQ